MKILITGNMGYVGPVLARHLRDTWPDAELVGFDAGWFAHCLVGSEPLPERVLDAQWFGDVREIATDDLRGFDAVVHLAAVSNDPMGVRFETVTDAINHRASVQLAHKAADAGVRHFVFASSCSVYGQAGDGKSRREGDPVHPLTAYARSKIDTETALAGLSNGDMNVTLLRFATACGWSPRLRLDLVVNDFVASAVALGEVKVLSDGTPWRPLIHVRDMARAIEWALTRARDAGGPVLTVNVGSEAWTYQVRELAEAVARQIPGTQVDINGAAPPDKRSYRVDFSLFRTLAPDHQPRETLDGTVSELRDRLQAAQFADPNFRASPMIRLHVLDGHMRTGALDEQLTWRERPRHAVPTDAHRRGVPRGARAQG